MLREPFCTRTPLRSHRSAMETSATSQTSRYSQPSLALVMTEGLTRTCTAWPAHGVGGGERRGDTEVIDCLKWSGVIRQKQGSVTAQVATQPYSLSLTWEWVWSCVTALCTLSQSAPSLAHFTRHSHYSLPTLPSHLRGTIGCVAYIINGGTTSKHLVLRWTLADTTDSEPRQTHHRQSPLIDTPQTVSLDRHTTDSCP